MMSTSIWRSCRQRLRTGVGKYIHTYLPSYLHTYIYIYNKRVREREIYIYTYTRTYMAVSQNVLVLNRYSCISRSIPRSIPYWTEGSPSFNTPRSIPRSIPCSIRLFNKYPVSIPSSTAQGGGGSFKNRKPIGEIGCCESGMAERIHWWTERCLRSPLFLSLSLTIYLPTYLSSMYLSIDLPLSLSFI